MRYILFVFIFIISACDQNLPQYSKVEDLRIISMQAEPPTYLFDQPDAELTFNALVLDPRGGPVDYTWSFCPVESTLACDDFEELVTQFPEDIQATLKTARQITLSGTALPKPEASDLPAHEAMRPYDIPAFTLTIEQLTPLINYFAAMQFGLGMGIWPSAILALSRQGEQVSGYKRVVVTVADLYAFNDHLQYLLGYSFCPPDQSDATNDCIAWHPELVANHNPIFDQLQWSSENTTFATWEDIPTDVPLHIQTDSEIRILPSFTTESSESFELLQTDLQSRTVQVIASTEEISVAWFVTYGKIKEELTWPKFTKTLDTIYTAPKTPPLYTDGLATLWLVARDHRGGESYTHIDLIIDP
ncbi:MAG: hypothetical protein JW841_00990 [Deltaproteobacteria bacterium]|nr:hypothetical protein [Deltaproteobacteria bacterium]